MGQAERLEVHYLHPALYARMGMVVPFVAQALDLFRGEFYLQQGPIPAAKRQLYGVNLTTPCAP